MKISTPCINLCQFDISKSYCLGCFRTRQEIIEWVDLSEDERKEIMKDLPVREIRG